MSHARFINFFRYRLTTAIHVLLIALLIALVFSNTLNNEYHLDSFSRIGQNTEIDTFWPPSRFFTDVRTGSTNPKIAEYRPLMPLSNSVNSELSRLTGTSRLTGFHIGNIAIHIGSSILAYFMFALLLSNYPGVAASRFDKGNQRQVAFVAALIFAVHPIAGSAVNYLAARDLLLMVFFLLFSMVVYIRMRLEGDSVLGWISALVLLSLAILSKQAAIMGFGFVFLFEWVLKGSKLWDFRLLLRTAIYAIPTAGYFLFRWILTSSEKATEGLRTPTDFSYPITMLDAHVFYYLRNFIWSFEMRALAKVEMMNSLLQPTVAIGILFIGFSLFLAWILRKKQPVISFCILSYWLFLSLTSSIFPFRYVVTDYRQYMSSVFLCLAVCIAVFAILRKPYAIAVSVVMVLYFSVVSHHLNSYWKTEESFWKQSVTYGAASLAHHNYAMSVVDKDPKLAEYHYHQALEQNPYNIYPNISLAMLEIRQKKYEEGLKRLRYMVALNPEWALSHYWLAVGLETTGQKDEAVNSAVQAANLDKRSLRYQYKAAKMLQSNGKRNESIPYYERVVAINPDYRIAEFWLAFMYQKTGQSQKSIDAYKRFIERNPDHVQGQFNLAYELKTIGNCPAAVPYFNSVLELQPSYKEAHSHLSRCYRSMGEDEKAEYHLTLYKK